jgi:hypothetical protein
MPANVMYSVRFIGRLLSLSLLTLLPAALLAQSLVTITVEAKPAKTRIPEDFVGLSFESSNLLPDKNGAHMFSAEDKPLVQLFRTIGIKNLRVGGGTAEDPRYSIPAGADIDQLFAFSKAAGVNVIYTLRLLNGSKASASAIANYIDSNYPKQLSYFQLGNEPDWHSYHTAPNHERDPLIVEAIPDIPGTAYPSFLRDWNDFALSIEKVAPAARFTGPDTGSNYPVPKTKNTDFDGESWTQRFADDEKSLRPMPVVTQHDYVGEDAKGVGIQEAIDAMLSPDWIATNYRLLYEHVLAPVKSKGVSYRMTECNDYTGGVDGASNAYASALWALDYMHWHALHGAVGVNFHNKRWIYTDTIYLDSGGIFQINPKAYGLLAFGLGSNGAVEPVTLLNPDSVNLTAYAVHGAQGDLVTVINKEHGKGARAVRARVVMPGRLNSVAVMYLSAPNDDVASKTGITLGGVAIKEGTWNGKWTSVPVGKGANVEIEVPAASAVVVKLSLK